MRNNNTITKTQNKDLFLSGRVFLTPGGQEAFEEANQLPNEFLAKHQKADWGTVCETDRKENDFSVKEGFRILSAFTLLNFVMLAGLISLVASSAYAQSGVGVKTDLGVYPEGSAPSLPAAGGKLTDSTFGTQIMRVTDQTDGTSLGTAYSYWSTFNSNNTRLLVQAGGTAYLYQFNPVNFALGAKQEMIFPPGSGYTTAEDAVWSAADPNTLFIHRGAVLYAFNAQERSYSLVGNLSSQFPAGAYLFQMSVSRNDDVFAFTVRNSDYSVRGYAVWKRSTNSIIHSVNTSALDEVQIDKTGRYLVVKTGQQGAGVIEVKVVDLQTQAVTNLTDNAPDFAPGHSDNGIGSVIGEDNWNNRITYRNLATPHTVRTVIQWSAWNISTHISMLADNEDWVLISTYGNSSIFNRELVLVATDGSQQVKRLAHHYSLVSNYEDSPRANISRDGKFIAFTSNWGGSSRRDLFIAKVPTDSITPSPTPTPTPTLTPTPPVPTPTPPPPPTANYTLAASPSSVAPGGQVTINWTAPNGSSSLDWVGLYKVGTDNSQYRWWQYTNGATSGSITVSAPIQPDQYEFRYLLNDGYTSVKTSNVVTVPSSANQLPVAVAGAVVTAGLAPLTVNFSSQGSYDPDGTIVSYAWNFGDGTTSTAPNPVKVYNSVGLFTAVLTVTDNSGLTDTDSVVITATAQTSNQSPVAVAGASVTAGFAPLTVNFSSQGSYDPDGTIVSYAWNFGDGTSSTAPNPVKVYNSPGLFTAVLTVTDNSGLTGTESVVITKRIWLLIGGFDELFSINGLK